MRWMKWTGIAAAIFLIIACCMTWVTITPSPYHGEGRGEVSPSPYHGEGRGEVSPSPSHGEGRGEVSPSPSHGEGRGEGSPSPSHGEGRGEVIVSGIDATGTNFGKPAYFHFVATFFFLLFTLTPRVWAKRANLLVTAVNMAWAVRNYFVVTMCREGDCPEKHVAVYIILVASLLMLVSSLFPDLKQAPKSPAG